MGYTQKMLCQNSSVMHFAFLIIFYIYNYKKMKRNRHLKNLHICKKGREKHAHLIINCTQVDFQTKRFWLCLKKKENKKGFNLHPHPKEQLRGILVFSVKSSEALSPFSVSYRQPCIVYKVPIPQMGNQTYFYPVTGDQCSLPTTHFTSFVCAV